MIRAQNGVSTLFKKKKKAFEQCSTTKFYGNGLLTPDKRTKVSPVFYNIKVFYTVKPKPPWVEGLVITMQNFSKLCFGTSVVYFENMKQNILKQILGPQGMNCKT